MRNSVSLLLIICFLICSFSTAKKVESDERCQIKKSSSLDGFYENDPKGAEFKTAFDNKKYQLKNKPTINAS